MVRSSTPRGSSPRTLAKIVLMLGVVLAGVAALATEPSTDTAAPTETAAASSCAESQFVYDGRDAASGTPTDSWTLTCWRHPAEAAAKPASTRPVEATPVATQPYSAERGTGPF